MVITENTALLSVDEPTSKNSVNDSSNSKGRNSLIRREIWKISLVACFGNILLQFSHGMTGTVMHQYSYHYFMLEQQNANETSINETSSHITCSKNGSEVTKSNENTAQKLTAQWDLYISLATYLPAVIMSIFLIPYSDSYGRKIFFLLPFVGTLLKSVFCAFGIYFNINIEWFVLFYFIEGCTGFWISSLTISVCITADVTDKGKERSFIISLLETSTGIGNFLSAFLSGYIIKWTHGYLVPEIVAVCFVVSGILLVLFGLPETASKSNQKKNTLCDNLKTMIEFYTKESSPKGNRKTYIILIIIFVFTCLNSFSKKGLDTLYVLGSPFCWDSVKIGWFGALKTFIGAVGGLIMVKTMHFCAKDDIVLLAGLASSTASLVLEAFARSTVIMFLVPVVAFGNTMTMPMVRGLMSAITPESKQGSLFGGIAAVEAISHVISSLSANSIYKETVTWFKGFTFLLMAGWGIVGMILCLWIIIRRKR